MTQTHPAPNEPRALTFYLIAAVILGGAVGGILTMGLAGMTLWIVGLTFLALFGMIVVPFR